MWTVWLGLRTLGNHDALPRFFAHQLSPPKGLLRPKPIPQLRKVLEHRQHSKRLNPLEWDAG
jgi:hypothetical protein